MSQLSGSKREVASPSPERESTDDRASKKVRFDLQGGSEHPIPSRAELARMKEKGKEKISLDDDEPPEVVTEDDDDGITLYSDSYMGAFKQTFDKDAEGVEVKVKEFSTLAGVDGEEQVEADPLSLKHDEDVEDYDGNFMAFNMDEDREEGYFDENGHYRLKTREMLLEDEKRGEELAAAPAEAQEDAWLEDAELYATSNVKKLLEHKAQRDQVEDTKALEEMLPVDQLISQAYDLLLPQETVQRALVRLGNKKRKIPKWKRKKKKSGGGGGGDTDDGKEKDEEARKDAQKKFDKLTDITSALMMRGVVWSGVYSMTRDDMTDALEGGKPSKSKGDEDAMSGTNPRWEYKKTLEDTVIHGPYENSSMITWRSQGYFVGEYRVFLRRVGSKGAFTPSDDVDFTKYQ